VHSLLIIDDDADTCFSIAFTSTRDGNPEIYVMNPNGSGQLRLGHYTTEVTMRYGHLVQGQFSAMERALADVQFKPGKVFPLRGRAG
jgi:hypothetical protein